MGPLSAYPWQLQAIAVGVITAAQVACWWFLVVLVWKSLKTRITASERWEIIKSDPKALAIVMAAVYGSTAYLVASGFSRFIG
jgi:hypothetical protein